MEQSPLIEVKKVKGKGRGVFAKKRIAKGTLIERVPVVLVPIASFAGGRQNKFVNTYLYVWDEEHMAICLVYGLMYNHSFESNAKYIFGKNQMTYRARRDIEAGEEITINYNYYPNNREPLGFEIV